MKTRFALLAIFLLTALMLSGCSNEVAYYRDAEETISVKVKREFVIAVPSNPSSVFMWRETYDENMVELVTHIFGINEEAKELGEELYLEQQLHFKVLEAGSTNITMALVRRTTSETLVAEERMFTVNIE